MENIMEAPQKIKNRISLLSKIPSLGIFPKKTKTVAQKDICSSMFIAALFTITKVMEATTVSIYRWMDKEDVRYVCEKNKSTCSYMDGQRGYYA